MDLDLCRRRSYIQFSLVGGGGCQETCFKTAFFFFRKIEVLISLSTKIKVQVGIMAQNRT
jgi:hypothetical protein